MGKRLIAHGLVKHPDIQVILKKRTLVIVAGTTNGYVAEEILTSLEQVEGFSRLGFRRGIVMPPGFHDPLHAEFPGDVILVEGKWQKGKTIFDVAEKLQAGDIVLKGANAVNLTQRRAAVYVGHPNSGTIGAALPAIYGRRVRLIIPVGSEKRISENLHDLANQLNAPDVEGPRLVPLPGEIFTELDAIALLTGASARLVAGGGIYGAEGCLWIAVQGDDQQLQAAEQLISSLKNEPPCQA